MSGAATIAPARDASAVRTAADALAAGRLVVIPTDTVYGLAADPRVSGAEERLRAAKGREPRKPIPILAADADAVTAAGFAMNEIERRLATVWPGPLTIVLRKGDATEGIRVPDHPVARSLIRECGGLLRVTSANRSGEEPARTASEAEAALGGKAAVILDDGPSPGGTPSTVVRVDDGRLVILREGAIPREALEKTARGTR
jgi:tRNA threonylcarbamoyl adenosine modification protein (Sua5/YciO/YrdC/YwlC family)